MFFLSLRYLLSRRRQTLLTLLGIFFGTAAYVSISGFILGFREYLIEQLINNSAHISIQAREEFLNDHDLDQVFYQNQYQAIFWDPPPSGRKDSAIVEKPQSWYELLKADPRVKAFSPQLTAAVVFSNGKATASSLLIGCDPDQQVHVTNVGNNVIQGSFHDIALGGNRIVIGEELRKKLGVNLQQNILISLPQKTPMPFKVVGVFQTGTKQSDEVAYAEIHDVQRVNQSFNQVNAIDVRLEDHTLAAQMATTWSQLSPENVESWDQKNARIFDVFRIQDAIRYLSVGSVLVVAGFGIYNVLNITVIQKRRDVAILHSIGYTSGDMISLFFVQGLIVGLIGTAFGLLFGYGFCNYMQTVPFSGGPMATGLNHLMVSLNPNIYIQGTILGILSACVASILPARAAGKLTPIEIIRSGE